jgi:hypothetical protein
MSTSTKGKAPNLSVTILVDFDNLYKDVTGPDFHWVNHQLNKFVELALGVDPNVEELVIRMYGGWIQGGILTARASALLSVLGGTSFFPIKHPKKDGVLRGTIGLATRLIGVPSVEWDDTRRVKNGLPKLRLAKETLPSKCINPASCPATTLSRFTKHKSKLCPTPGCSVTNSEAFQTVEQKMVDTMIACDAIFLALDETQGHVLVVSDDSDVVPAVALAQTLSNRPTVRLVTTNRTAGTYDTTMNSIGVECCVFEAD